MSYLDFLVDLGSTGRVLGLGLDASPAEWSVLDPGHEESVATFSGSLCHFYGLLDVWFEPDAAQVWRCQLVTVRLVERYPDEALCRAVRERYGDAPDRLPFADLVAHAERAGLAVRRVARHHEAALDRYWFPAGNVEVAVVAEHQADDFPGHRAGDVHSVSVPDYVIEPELLTPYPVRG